MSEQPERDSHLFVSPHFDDAVLSCGGAIRQLVAQGHSVTVLTTMGGAQIADLPDTPIVADLHRRWMAGGKPLRTRQQEDAQALRSLGAGCRHLPILDCVYRQVNGVALYPSEESLFGDIHPLDDAPDLLLACDMLDRERPNVVYLPLAVGHHVDHQIVRDWGESLLSRNSQSMDFCFYAEYPYSRSERAVAAAVSRSGLRLRPQRFELSESEIKSKIDAIACYQSQISTFWADLQAMQIDVRHSSTDAATGKFVERFWLFEPGQDPA